MTMSCVAYHRLPVTKRPGASVLALRVAVIVNVCQTLLSSLHETDNISLLYCNYTGLLPTCQRRGNRLKYTYDARRRTASPSGRKSKPQSVGRGTAAVERAIGPGQCSDQGAGRHSGQRQSNEQ